METIRHQKIRCWALNPVPYREAQFLTTAHGYCRPITAANGYRPITTANGNRQFKRAWRCLGQGRGCRWWKRRRDGTRLEQVVQQGKQREQQEDGEGYENEATAIARPW